MSTATLEQVLLLVGKLDDTPGEDTARERFRRHFLQDSVTDVAQVRDYIQECLRTPGDQYNRALQDLANHLGRLLEFDVTFGRYQGVQNQIGFDGLWRSPDNGLAIVVEVKTTEVYAIKTATLVNYIDQLISAQEISDWEHALGLYVLGRPDPDTHHLENSIVAEKRTDQLRIISVESLLSLAELMNEFDVSHDDILSVIKPSGPTIDPIIDLMARLVAQRQVQSAVMETSEKTPYSIEPSDSEDVEAATVESNYWLTPVKSQEEQTAEDCIKTLVGHEKIYAFGERTPGRKHLKPGDWICFYATGNGVIAHAKVSNKPKKKPHPKVRSSEKYPWVFTLANSKLYVENPVIIDAALRGELEAFNGRDLNSSWAWFVQTTREITTHDFELLTRK